jgi:hypothetical protein
VIGSSATSPYPHTHQAQRHCSGNEARVDSTAHALPNSRLTSAYIGRCLSIPASMVAPFGTRGDLWVQQRCRHAAAGMQLTGSTLVTLDSPLTLYETSHAAQIDVRSESYWLLFIHHAHLQWAGYGSTIQHINGCTGVASVEPTGRI